MIVIFGLYSSTYILFEFPLGLKSGFVGIGLYHIGTLIRSKNTHLNKLNMLIGVFALVVFSILIFVNDTVNMREGSYGCWLLFYINATGITISLINLSRIGWNNLEKCKFSNEIVIIGEYSIVYLAFNQLCIMIARNILNIWVDVNSLSGVTLLIHQIIVLLITLILLRILLFVFYKTKVKVIIGKSL